MRAIARTVFLGLLMAAPLFASAQNDPNFGKGIIWNTPPTGNTVTPTSGPGGAGSLNVTYLRGYAGSIINIINVYLIPVLLTISFLVFLWGVFNYFIWGADNEESRATGRQFVLYGIIGFVVIFSVWGLVGLVMGTFNLSSGGAETFRLKPPTL